MATVIQYKGRSSIPADPVPALALDAAELGEMNKGELADLAESLNVAVKGTGSQGAILKADIVAALLASEQG